MKTALFIGALFGVGAEFSTGGLEGHGGTYRGPGDTVPPGGGSPPAGPSGPVHPGPSVRVGSGPGGASGPGGSGPGGASGPDGAGRITPRGSVAPDLTDWNFWWGFNKDPYLQLGSRVHEVAPWTGSDDGLLGRGLTFHPSPRVVREEVVPALLEVLERESANDVLDAALLALAKIGDVVGEDGFGEVSDALQGHLDHANQQVAESAAVALGVLGSPGSVPLLLELLRDTRAGRELVGRNEVPYRTRAFAAYGLGLVAQRSSDHALRAEIGLALIEVLEAPHFSTRDLKVAAMTALGLCPLDWSSFQDSAEPVVGDDPEPPTAHVVSRETQLAYLLDYLDPAGARAHRDTRHWFVRAHAPTALARLVAADEGIHRERVARALLALVGRHPREREEIRQSCVLALGNLGDASEDGADDVDTEIRDALIRVVADGAPMERRFALVSLARSAGRAGGGPAGAAGVERVSDVLVRTLARSETLGTWAGLSIGVLADGLADSGAPEPTRALRALAEATRECRRPADIGAHAIGLGIARQASSEDLLRDRLEFFSGSDEAQGYCAVALGMIGARGQLDRIREFVARAEYRAPLLREAAIALALLGDEELVPWLVERLGTSRGQATRAALATALGTIGDSRSIDPLLARLRDPSSTPSARGFAAAALGMVCDEELLPWNATISVGTNYRANTRTLTGGGAGILDLL